MTSRPAIELSAVLDACVLVPASLCDLLLRLAEEPAIYCPLWSERILGELGAALKVKLGRTAAEISYRCRQMNRAFPEAISSIPSEFVEEMSCLPDKNDNHVLAVAILRHADLIITQNTKHFPEVCLKEYGVRCKTAQDFLIDQLGTYRQLILDRLDDQAAAISQSRQYVLSSLETAVPRFVKILRER